MRNTGLIMIATLAMPGSAFAQSYGLSHSMATVFPSSNGKIEDRVRNQLIERAASDTVQTELRIQQSIATATRSANQAARDVADRQAEERAAADAAPGGKKIGSPATASGTLPQPD